MPYALTADDLLGSHKQDVYVEAERATFEIFDIEFYLLWNRQFVPAIDLRPSRQSGQELVDTMGGAQLYQIILIVECRPWPDETHLPLENAPELWQFVEAGFAQKRADGCQKPIWIFEQMRGNRRCVDAHAAKFRHQEDLIETADTFDQ